MKTLSPLPLSVLFLLLLSSLQAQTASSPLTSPQVVECLAQLKDPTLGNAVAVVGKLNALAASNAGEGGVALQKLATVIKDLFTAANAVRMADQGVKTAEAEAKAKEIQAQHAAKVNVFGKRNLVLAGNLRKQAADGVALADKRHKAAKMGLGQQIGVTNKALAEYSKMNVQPVVLAVAGAMFALGDELVPDFSYTPAVSKRWVQLVQMSPEERDRAQTGAAMQLAGSMAAEIVALRMKSSNFQDAALKIGVVWLAQVAFDDALDTLFYELTANQRKVISIAWHGLMQENLTAASYATKVTVDSLKAALAAQDPELGKMEAIAEKAWQVLKVAVEKSGN